MLCWLVNPPYAAGIIREGRCQSPVDMRRHTIPQYTLAVLGGMLRRHNHTVIAHDCIADNLGTESILAGLTTRNLVPDAIFVNTSTPSLASDLVFIGACRAAFPLSKIAAFGTHVSVCAEDVLRSCPALDACLQGEPEHSLLQLLDWWRQPDATIIPAGCTVRFGDSPRSGPPCPFDREPDAYGFPAWDLLPYRAYIHPIYQRPYLILNTARGCPFACSFCVARLYYGSRIRYRSVASLLDELRENLRLFGIHHYWFYADTFTADPAFVRSLCEEIIRARLNLVWWSNTRAGLGDRELFSLMHRAGCVMLSIGGESGSAAMLARNQKGTCPGDIARTVAAVKSAGITSLVYFLIGLPGENRATLRETVAFARHCAPDYAEFLPAIPYPGTPFYHEAVATGLIADTTAERYLCGGRDMVVRIPGIPETELPQLLTAAYRSFYLRPGYALTLLRRLRQPQELAALASFAISYVQRFRRQ